MNENKTNSETVLSCKSSDNFKLVNSKVCSRNLQSQPQCDLLLKAQNEQFQKASDAVKGDADSILHVRSYRPHGLKLIPSRVLEEDDYVRLLQTIIERDFFPDLIKLRLEMDILLKERAGETQAARSVALRLASIKTEQREATLQPNSRSCLSGPLHRVTLRDGRKLELDVSKLTLSEFQSLFTSEDNASFESIVQMEKTKLMKQQEWMERLALSHSSRNEEIKLALESGEKPARLHYSNSTSRNPFMFPITDGNVGIMELKGASPAEIVALSFGTFPKDNEISDRPTVKSGVIVHSNTRISQPGKLEEEEDSVGTSLLESMRAEQHRKILAQEQTFMGESLFNEMVTQGKYSASAIEHQRQLEELNRKKGMLYKLEDLKSSRLLATPVVTPSHNGYQFLHTPSFNPGIEASPFMTWGEVAATPLLLSGGSAKKKESEGPRFDLPELSAKEMTAQRLQQKASERLRAQKSRKASNLREALKAVTPVNRGQSSLQRNLTGGLFGTPRNLTRSRLFRCQNSSTQQKILKSFDKTTAVGLAFTPSSSSSTTLPAASATGIATNATQSPNSSLRLTDNFRQPSNITDSISCNEKQNFIAVPSQSEVHNDTFCKKRKRETKVVKNITDDLLEF